MSKWKKVKIGILADSISETHSFNKKELIFLNTSDIYEGKVLNTSYSQISAYPGQAKKSIKKDDILLSEIRPANKRYAFINFQADDYVVSTKLMVIRSKGEVLPKYLYYFLASREISLWLQHLAESRSGTFPQITFDQVADLDLNLPAKDVQEKIVSIVENLDDKIELNRRMNETLEATARATFKSWFADFDPVRAKMEGRWRRGESLPGLPAHLYDLFPFRLVNSELGQIPDQWKVRLVGDVIERLSVGKKYEQKTVSPTGKVPVLDQGKTRIIGYHNDEPGIVASTERPVALFANHTCYMRLINFPFSAIQNVLPFVGKGVDTIWVFYATYGKQSFIEYKGHWPDFVIHKIIVPDPKLTIEFSKLVHGLLKMTWVRDRESHSLASLRDALLPKLISGELRVKDAERLIGRAL